MEVHWAHMGKTGGREPPFGIKTSIRRVEAAMKKALSSAPPPAPQFPENKIKKPKSLGRSIKLCLPGGKIQVGRS